MKKLRYPLGLRTMIWSGIGLIALMDVAMLWQRGYGPYVLALSGDPAREYAYGRWLDAHNYRHDALMWMSLAADHNSTDAMVWLGLAYQGGGYFAMPDMQKSFSYFKEAAERRNAYGMFGYAMLWETWEKLRQPDPAHADRMALLWYTWAAEAGLDLAQARLAEVYGRGQLGAVRSKTDAKN